MNAIVLGLGAAVAGLLGYRRYKSVKVGDQVVVLLGFGGLPPQPPASSGLPNTITARVVGLKAQYAMPDGSQRFDGLSVAPIIGGVQSPASTNVPPNAVAQNLTPRLF